METRSSISDEGSAEKLIKELQRLELFNLAEVAIRLAREIDNQSRWIYGCNVEIRKLRHRIEDIEEKSGIVRPED